MKCPHDHKTDRLCSYPACTCDYQQISDNIGRAPAAQPAEPVAQKRAAAWRVWITDDYDAQAHYSYSTTKLSADYEPVTVADLVALANAANRAAQPQASTQAQGAAQPFQQRLHSWVVAAFGEQVAGDKIERNHRFLEESLELVQALGCTPA